MLRPFVRRSRRGNQQRAKSRFVPIAKMAVLFRFGAEQICDRHRLVWLGDLADEALETL
jgi:hypothetical protein